MMNLNTSGRASAKGLCRAGLRRVVLAVVVLGAAAAAAAGCQSPVNTVEKAHPAAKPDYQAVKKVTLDSTLARRTNVESVSIDGAGDVLRVQANLHNRGSRAQGFKYRFTWFDGRGNQLYDPTATWARKTLQQGEMDSLVGVAPSPKAVDWRLSVQAWKPQ